MNQVIEISEVGPDDGKQLAIPSGDACFYTFEREGTGPDATTYRVKYGNSGRRNSKGFPIYVRMERERKEA